MFYKARKAGAHGIICIVMQRTRNEKRETKSIEEIVNTLLKNRGIITGEQREEFFAPTHPGKISAKKVGISTSQLKKAVARIKKAIKTGEKVIIYGDYDVDGICAACILWETLTAVGVNVLPYIPSRFAEGYGLNKDSIQKLKEEDPKIGLIITVDNGIVAHEKIDFAKGLGLDVIITDHHQPGETLPGAYAIVHTTAISGSAVAWFVSQALAEKRKTKNEKRYTTSDHLGLAALGTIADVLPLVGHNRSIVKHGLEVLRTTSRPGIVALCREAAIKQDEIDTFHVSFILAPRLNAAGRVEHALNSLRLLCTTKKDRAAALSFALGQANRLRQEKTELATAHIEENFAKAWNNDNLPPILFAYHSTYEEGVVGIVAGRLVEKYWRPAIVMSQGETFSKASARSISAVNIIDTIREAGEGLLVAAGGHPMAAGFTLETKNIEVFGQKLAEAGSKIGQEAFAREVRVDCQLSFADISDKLYQKLAEFAPFGFGNPQPTFKTGGVVVEDARLVGKQGEHLKLVLTQQASYGAIGFRMGGLYSQLSLGKPVTVVYSIEEDNWPASPKTASRGGTGNRKLQLKLKTLEVMM